MKTVISPRSCKIDENGRFARPDGIPIQLVKISSDVLFKHLAFIFNYMTSGEGISRYWKTAYITNINKKDHK